MKEKGIEDEVYRSQVFQSNEERNRIARLGFEERKQKNINDEKQRGVNNKINEDANKRADFALQASSFKPGSKAYNIWMLNQSHIKDNPLIKSEIENTFNVQDELTDRIRSTVAMNPVSGLGELRKIARDKNLNDAHFGLIQTLTKQFKDDAEITQVELEAQPSYTKLANERKLLMETRKDGPQFDESTGEKETLDSFKNKIDNMMTNVDSYEKDVMEEARSLQGTYPGLSIPFYEQFPNDATFDSVEDTVDDKQVDEVLSVLGSPPIESAILPPEFAPPEKPSTPPQMYTEDSLGVPQDIEAVPPEEAEAFLPARDYSPASSEDMEKYGNQIFFDKGTSQWYDLQTMEPATISQIKKHQGKDKPKGLSKYQKNNINRALKQIAQLETKTFDKDTLEGKINRLKKKILNIDPNYKFKN